MAIRCPNCQHENPRQIANCENCGNALADGADTKNLAKANAPMVDKDISDDTTGIQEDILPPTEDALPPTEAALPHDDTTKTPAEAHRTDSTIEAKAVDSDAILKAEEERRKTEQLPDIEDEESVLRIGAVRFRGDLVLKHPETNTDFTIKNNALQEVVLGRLDRATGFMPTVDLTDLGGKVKGVSRRHATISIRGDLLVITDHNSMNGTFLNGQRLVPEQARVLRDTDVLRIGRISLLIHFKNH